MIGMKLWGGLKLDKTGLEGRERYISGLRTISNCGVCRLFKQLTGGARLLSGSLCLVFIGCTLSMLGNYCFWYGSALLVRSVYTLRVQLIMLVLCMTAAASVVNQMRVE